MVGPEVDLALGKPELCTFKIEFKPHEDQASCTLGDGVNMPQGPFSKKVTSIGNFFNWIGTHVGDVKMEMHTTNVIFEKGPDGEVTNSKLDVTPDRPIAYAPALSPLGHTEDANNAVALSQSNEV